MQFAIELLPASINCCSWSGGGHVGVDKDTALDTIPYNL